MPLLPSSLKEKVDLMQEQSGRTTAVRHPVLAGCMSQTIRDATSDDKTVLVGC